jgi:hypothetical protein
MYDTYDRHLDLNVVGRQLPRLILPQLELLVWFVHCVAFVLQRLQHHLPPAGMLHLHIQQQEQRKKQHFNKTLATAP